jgi:predicted nucleotidyltransferase
MATKYLKLALESELKTWSRVSRHELEAIRNGWIKDIADIDKLIREHVSIRLTEETDNDPGFEYSVEVCKQRQALEQTRKNAVDAALKQVTPF